MRIPSIAKLGAAAALIIFLCAALTPLPFRLRHQQPITLSQAKQLLQALRQGLGPSQKTEIPKELEAIADLPVPAVLTVWYRGVKRLGEQTDGVSLRQTLTTFDAKLDQLGPRIQNDPRTKLQLDLVTATAWIPNGGLAAALAFVEGRDGISGIVAGRRIYLPPTELFASQLYGGFRPMPQADPNFRIGLNFNKLDTALVTQAQFLRLPSGKPTDLGRFRALSVVEGRHGVPRRIFKTTVEREDAASRDAAYMGVFNGSQYLIRMLKSDGLFRYYYNPLKNRDVAEAYNWPRHAGTAYSLALIGRILGSKPVREAAGKALVPLVAQLGDGPAGSRCLIAANTCYMGASALGLLALAEYRIAATGDATFDVATKGLAQFLLAMQRKDGSFNHFWTKSAGIDPDRMVLYATSQAVLALARYAQAVGDETARQAAIRGMDYLAGPYWDHFLGSYFFLQEHWTCLAAEEVYAFHPQREYAQLCYQIGLHYDRITHNEGETPLEEDVGGMSVGHVTTPHIGGTATAAEAMVSAIILGNAIGEDTAAIRQQYKETVGYLLRGQVTYEDAFWMPDSKLPIGGIYDSQSIPKIRIDTVQHSISAMVRGMELLRDDH